MDPISDTVMWYALVAHQPLENSIGKFLRLKVVEINEKHSILFGALVNEIAEPPQRHTHEIDLRTMWDEIFIDGVINWGRILAMIAFAGCLARHYGRTEYVECIAHRTREYFHDHLAHWVIEQGGWAAVAS